MHGAFRQPPQQEGIHGAEGQFAVLRLDPRAGHVVEKPCDLGGGEIGIEHESGARRDQRLMAGVFELSTHRVGAAILPHDGIVDRLAVGAVPHERRLALVGDADGRDVARRKAGLGDGFAAGRKHRAPKILRVMLHPAGLWEALRKFLLGHRRYGAIGTEHDRARGGRALVDRENVAGHEALAHRYDGAHSADLPP